MKNLSKEHVAIMEHTRNGAAGGRYCGSSKEMQDLVGWGYMESIGRVSWVPSEYFQLTAKGRRWLNEVGEDRVGLTELCALAGALLDVTEDSADSNATEWSGDDGSFAGGGASGSWDDEV